MARNYYFGQTIKVKLMQGALLDKKDFDVVLFVIARLGGGEMDMYNNPAGGR